MKINCMFLSKPLLPDSSFSQRDRKSGACHAYLVPPKPLQVVHQVALDRCNDSKVKLILYCHYPKVIL